MTSRIPYQPALDGLRGVAILGVLLKHAHVAGVPGADHGVTVFFVLSGYLITTILVAEWEERSTFSLRAFYRRRAARLVPVFLAWWTFTVVALLAIGKPLSSFLGYALTAVTYVINDALGWGFLSSTGDASAYLSHAWSLALEEQFYLVWPAALLLLLRLRRNPRFVAAATAGLTTLAVIGWRYYVVANGGSRPRVYFSTDTRLDSIMLGCFLALALSHKGCAEFVRNHANRLTVVGAAMVLAAVAWWLNAVDPWSSTTATVGAALLLAGLVSGRPTGVSRVLRSRPLRHVGVLSYSLYLWNPILLAFYLRTVGTVPSRSVLGLLWLAASLAVAEASYSWVERPARDRLRGRRPIVLPQQPVPAASDHPTGVMPTAVTTTVATAESAST